MRLKASSRPPSNSPGCIPFSCAARGSYQRTGDQNRHEPLPGTEMGRSSYRRRRQEAEAGPKEGERREAELGGSETRKPGSPTERETKIHLRASQSRPAAGPYWVHLAYCPPPDGGPAGFWTCYTSSIVSQPRESSAQLAGPHSTSLTSYLPVFFRTQVRANLNLWP